MRIKNIQKYAYLSVFLATLVIGTPVGAVSAQNTVTRGLTVAPIRTEIQIAPGTAQDKTLLITNNNDRQITVRLSTEEFSVINPQYDYAFNTETKLTNWVSFAPSTLELSPGETKQTTYTVGVPLDAEPGGRYLSLFATNDINTDGITSRQRIASLLYLTVSGDFSRMGQLVSLNAPWFLSEDSTWQANIQNSGTAHYRSRYNVVVSPIFGNQGEVSNQGDILILPGTIRLIDDKIPIPAYPGIYKVTYTIGLGDTPANIQTRYLVYLPPVVIIVGIFSIILIFSLVSEYRKSQKKKSS